jgi:ABC-type transporter lipoprotein component MlaA
MHEAGRLQNAKVQVAVATTQLAVTVGTTSLDAVDRLGQLKQAEDASIDFYSFIRSAYYQTRRAELREAHRASERRRVTGHQRS